MGRFASCRKYRTNYAALKEWAELVNPSGCHKRLGSHRIANCSYLYSFNQLVWIRLQFNTWQPFCLYAHNVEIRFLGTVVTPFARGNQAIDSENTDNLKRDLCYAFHSNRRIVARFYRVKKSYYERELIGWKVRRSWELYQCINDVRICDNQTVANNHAGPDDWKHLRAFFRASRNNYGHKCHNRRAHHFKGFPQCHFLGLRLL